jgi:phosphate starvation-inducible PhoH-like protein
LSDLQLRIQNVEIVDLLGENNSKLKILRDAFPDVKISVRGNTLRIVGEKPDTQEVKSRFETMLRILKERNELPINTVKEIANGGKPWQVQLPSSDTEGAAGVGGATIVTTTKGRPIRARTENQLAIVQSSAENDVVFAVGPAGTGKTYTAVALAVAALKAKQVKRIIMTRPAVEAGESLGFLPGDLKDKVDPYLRPLYDALFDMIPSKKLDEYMSNRTIEVAPLAFMRGRTLDNAFIILDEAQNCTTMQLKMFLTRLGPTAKCIITGDLSQVDLPYSQKSGLRHAIEILPNINGIDMIRLTTDDVVRHRLVKRIIMRYDEDDSRRREKRERGGDRDRSDRPRFRERGSYREEE